MTPVADVHIQVNLRPMQQLQDSVLLGPLTEDLSALPHTRGPVPAARPLQGPPALALPDTSHMSTAKDQKARVEQGVSRMLFQS